MLLFDGGLGLLLMGVWVFALIDVIQTDGFAVRNLPKTTWVMIVLFTFEIGAIAWFVAGRPQGSEGRYSAGAGRNRVAPSYPEYDRPGRYAAGRADDDDDFLRQVRERAETQRRLEAQRAQTERDRIRGHTRRDQPPATRGSDDDGSSAPPV
jgi:Phospholipase_D-nuclease N-terminal